MQLWYYLSASFIKMFIYLLLSPHNTYVQDILSGRGGAINSHPGNQRFRTMVDAHKQAFKDSKKRKYKRAIAKKLMNEIHNLTPPGRFLMETDEGKVRGVVNDDTDSIHPLIANKVWVVMDSDKALSKVMHRLREKEWSRGQKKQLELHGSNEPRQADGNREMLEIAHLLQGQFRPTQELQEASSQAIAQQAPEQVNLAASLSTSQLLLTLAAQQQAQQQLLQTLAAAQQQQAALTPASQLIRLLTESSNARQQTSQQQQAQAVQALILQQQRDQDLLTSQSQELHQLQQMMGIQVQGQAPTQQSALGQLLQMIQPASSEVPPPSTTALSLPQSTADLPFSPHRD